MMQLTGEIADGAVLNYLVSPEYNRQAVENLEIGAAKAGRSLDEIDRPQLVVCSVDHDRQAALDSARLLVTQYLGQQPHIMKASGVPQELLDDVAEVLTWPATHEQVVEAAKRVPDEVVQMITASGTPDEVRAKVAEYEAAGCTCPILYPLGDVELMIDRSPSEAPTSAVCGSGRAPDWHRRHAELRVVPRAHSAHVQPDRHPFVEHHFDEGLDLVGIRTVVALPDIHAQRPEGVGILDHVGGTFERNTSQGVIGEPSSTITVMRLSRRRFTTFCDLAFVSNHTSPSMSPNHIATRCGIPSGPIVAMVAVRLCSRKS